MPFLSKFNELLQYWSLMEIKMVFQRWKKSVSTTQTKSVKLTTCFIFEIYLSATQKTFLIRKQNKIQYICLDGSYSYVYFDASACPEGAE